LEDVPCRVAGFLVAQRDLNSLLGAEPELLLKGSQWLALKVSGLEL